MSEDITEQTVTNLARLSRLRLDAEETTVLRQDLKSILTYMEKLKDVQVEDLTATSHALIGAGLTREDILRPGVDVKTALGNAPERIGDGFGVPKIID